MKAEVNPDYTPDHVPYVNAIKVPITKGASAERAVFSTVNRPGGWTCRVRKEDCQGRDMTELDCRIECSIQITLFLLDHYPTKLLSTLIPRLGHRRVYSAPE